MVRIITHPPRDGHFPYTEFDEERHTHYGDAACHAAFGWS